MVGTGEIVVIGIAIIVIFGASRLPSIAKSFGQGIKEFKKAIKDTTEEEKSEADASAKTDK
jgi:sec-independent protein translocase protein TatA